MHPRSQYRMVFNLVLYFYTPLLVGVYICAVAQLTTSSGEIGSRRFVPIFLKDNISHKSEGNSSVIKTYNQIQPLQKSQVPSTSDGTTLPTRRSDYNVLDLVKKLDIRLKNIRNVELGVTIIQEIFDAMNFTQVARNESAAVAKFARRMSRKLESAISTIEKLKNFFAHNISQGVPGNGHVFLNTWIYPCPPFEDFTIEETYNKKQIQIINYLRNSDNYDGNDLNYTVNAKIVEEIRRLSGDLKHFKHVYFLSRDDHASDHNCQYYFNDIHFRYLYVSAIRRKHVFMLIDHGNAFNRDQMELSKSFVTNILNTMSLDDTITLATVCDKFVPMQLRSHHQEHDKLYKYPSTTGVKAEIRNFINKLNQSEGVTNHTLAFEEALILLRRQNISQGTPVKFLYVTRGLLSHLTEGLSVLTTISRLQRHLNFPVAINTCAVVLDEKRMMYEKQFLRDIAEQNYTKYNINVSDWYDADRHNIRGKLFIVTKRHLERIIKTSTAVFADMFTDEYLTDSLDFHLPAIDYNTKEVIVSLTKTIKPFGIVGVNVHLTDLAEDVIYFKQSEASYAFLVNMNGTVIFHPAFPRPAAVISSPFPVDIFYLENCTDFIQIRKQILAVTSNGVAVIESSNCSRTYTCSRVLEAYVVCIVTTPKGRFTVDLARVPANIHQHPDAKMLSYPELLYHRIDLVAPQTPLCRHFRQIATLDSGTVFLSASSFQSPFTYLRNSRENREDARTHTAQSIVAYIKDITNLLANPGLRPQIRNDVSALYHVMSYLKKRHQESGALRKYIIRRYIATTNGVLQVYPGCILGTELEPSRRPWYRKAMRHSGKIVVTEPYLDAGGAGYIVTIAHTIFEGKANALHNAERDVPVAIVAIDVPYAYLYKLVIESDPICSEVGIKCILIEDEGYLVAHPSVLEPVTSTRNNRRPLEHITHKESFVANDILNHKKLVQKKVCGNYQNRTIQRYYTFNTSLDEVLTNVAHGDKTKYQIALIRGTNVFAAVLNSTCDGGAFCPCSTVDRVCLNCNRMDQTDCECPCECPLNIPHGFDESLAAPDTILRYCEPPNEDLAVVNSLSYDWSMALKSCISINCDVHTTQTECLGVMGCEWCQLDINGNPFSVQFCASQSSCFNGVLGSMTPYGDGDLGSAILEPSTPPAYSAIGPVGGAIIALCLVVGFAMYCYRQNLDNNSEQFYADSMQEDNYGVPLSRFNFDDISPHDDSDLSGGGQISRNLLHSVVANAIAVGDMSPYHMSSGGYRRPNGESDHGYSTMTPHEDSEHMCFTLVEPLINKKRLSMSDSLSINTSVSSPTNQNSQTIPLDRSPASKNVSADALGQTIVHEQISPHHILAPVTVHRHMEAS